MSTSGKKHLLVSDEEEEDMCWLCHEGGPNESGQPLRRDCSCRGRSGWAHLSCIVGHAKHKSEQWDDSDDGSDKFGEPWCICPRCKQNYQNELNLDLANEFVAFVEEKYPDVQRKQLIALRRKQVALLAKIRGNCLLQPKEMEETKHVSNRMLSITGQMKTVDPTLPKFIKQFEASAYNSLGQIVLREEETKEGAKTAVEHFEKALDICETIGSTRGISVAENNIAHCKTILAKYEGNSK